MFQFQAEVKIYEALSVLKPKLLRSSSIMVIMITIPSDQIAKLARKKVRLQDDAGLIAFVSNRIV